MTKIKNVSLLLLLLHNKHFKPLKSKVLMALRYLIEREYFGRNKNIFFGYYAWNVLFKQHQSQTEVFLQYELAKYRNEFLNSLLWPDEIKPVQLLYYMLKPSEIHQKIWQKMNTEMVLFSENNGLRTEHSDTTCCTLFICELEKTQWLFCLLKVRN